MDFLEAITSNGKVKILGETEMSREIEFRGISVKKGGWVFGDRVEVGDKIFIILKPYYPTGFIGWVVGGLVEVDPETVEFNVGEFWFSTELFEKMAMQSHEYMKKEFIQYSIKEKLK